MEKKLYNQPTMNVTALMPTTSICASVGNGGGTDSLTPPGSGGIDGD